MLQRDNMCHSPLCLFSANISIFLEGDFRFTDLGTTASTRQVKNTKKSAQCHGELGNKYYIATHL